MNSYALIIIFLINWTYCTKQLVEDYIPCGNFTVINGHGKCIKNDTEYESICYDLYATHPENSTFRCNYTRKKQLTAFLLETFVTYGAGHYYIEVYEMAVPKTVYWIFCYCLFIVLRVILKSNEEANTTGLIMTLLSFMFLIGMLAWQVTDMILYGTSNFKDGNGIELLSWNVETKREF